MGNYAVVTDSNCDLTHDLRERFGVDAFIPSILTYPDGREADADLDWTTTTPEEYFKYMSDKKTFISTGQPGTTRICECFEKFLKEGHDILSINISTGISGTVNGINIAANELKEKYPDRKIIIIDSLKYSSAIGLLVIYAALNRDKGMTIEENAAWLETNKYRLHQMGVLDDLFFCSKMGRVSGVTAVSGTLIGIKPLADFDRNGLSHKIGACRGLKNAYRIIIDYIAETILAPEEQIIIVDHSLRYEEASTLKKLIEEKFAPREVIITHVGQSNGPGIGPGLFAVFYMGTEISADMQAETEILSEIINKKRGTH